LPAGTPAAFLCPTLYVDRLAEGGAAKAVRIVVIGADLDHTAASVPRIAPGILLVGPARIESVIIGPVGVAAVFATEIAHQASAGCPAENNSGDGCTAIAMSGGITDQPANQGTRDYPGRIGRPGTLLVIHVVIGCVDA